MIWIILFFIIILISSVLAYRSMRDYEEFPDSLNLNALFYIGNNSALNTEILKKLHDNFLPHKQFFSIEKLVKGKENARVIFGPRDLLSSFPELNLVEIEDYVVDERTFLRQEDYEKKVNVNQVLSWLIEPKNNPKKPLHIDEQLRDLSLESDQKVFFQVVLMPLDKSDESAFQTSLRIMVADPDPIKRVELAKKINQLFSLATGLNKHEDDFPQVRKFESFKQRSIVPKEVSEFLMSPEDVLALIS